MRASRDRIAPWLGYDPFADDDCLSCIALPGCMGGCAHHDFHGSREDRCGSFRLNHREKVRNEAHRHAGKPLPPTGLAFTTLSQGQGGALAETGSSTPVTLGRTQNRAVTTS